MIIFILSGECTKEVPFYSELWSHTALELLIPEVDRFFHTIHIYGMLFSGIGCTVFSGIHKKAALELTTV